MTITGRLRAAIASGDFLRLETAGGLLLILVTGLALWLANSGLAGDYQSFIALSIRISVGQWELAKPLLLWVNDGLMAVFFMLVALEIKREAAEGALSDPKRAALPGLAALGGMLVPALIYAAANIASPQTMRGWAIPSATDIAFSLGVLGLLGRRVPAEIRIFLAALAIIDDLGAIIIIAIFYTEKLSLLALGAASAGIALLVILNLAGVSRRAPYLLAGAFIWLAVLKSGVHATLAGVVVGMAIPLRDALDSGKSPLKSLEHDLHPWVAFLIMPLFALVNAGVGLTGIDTRMLLNPVFLGIGLGLFIGKPVGVLSFSWAAVRLGWAVLPKGAGWGHMLGAAALTGIGFTMSLFIGTLAFDDMNHEVPLRLGVLTGSLASAILGAILLSRAMSRPGESHPGG